MEVRINLNEKVKFKLSERGKEIYRHRYDGYGFEYDREPELDDDGYMSMQLWTFMRIFGEHMTPGVPEVVQPLEIIYELRSEDWRRSGMRIAWRTDNPPEEKDEYLVTYDGGRMDICQWTNVNRFWSTETTNWHWRSAQYCKVVAWMLLPESYKGDTE